VLTDDKVKYIGKNVPYFDRKMMSFYKNK